MTDDNNNQLTKESKPEASDKISTFPTEEQGNVESKAEIEEIKKLEEKEHYELDYFSKEDLVKKYENLEKELAKSKEEINKLKEEIKKVTEENEKSKNKYMHLQAEFENAQKRWDKNRQNLRIEYTGSVLKSFLPLYDSFKKALESSNEAEKNVLEGFYKQFMNIFKTYDAKPMEVKTNDSFDYSLHEALSTVEKDDVPENTILDVIQEGFKYGKEVLRYANVIISRKPKPPKPEPEEKGVKEEVSEETKAEEEISEHKEAEEKKSKEKKYKKLKKEKDTED
ncbi:MAG: nucleotide exchange factor GrpE [Promethearchaeota archaeon]